ncbi:hypothetical protein K8I28_00790 [bacterium]|nr:hypothetical protein [bacterium]
MGIDGLEKALDMQKTVAGTLYGSMNDMNMQSQPAQGKSSTFSMPEDKVEISQEGRDALAGVADSNQQ